MPLAHHKRKDGSTFTAEMSASTFLWKGRRMLVGIVRDITERRRIQKLSHSLALARDIQQHLLPPQPPAIENLDIHVRHLYCETIGGDYYDFLHHDDQADGVLEFMVGDIAGHGVGSALLMAMAKGVLRNETLHHHTAPENIFNSLNNSLVKDTDDEMFMTMFYGRIDIKSCSLTWNSAGHGPVFWYRSNLKRVEELPTTNIPLGIFADAITTPTQSVRLTPGDILLIGTDGLWETRNGQNQMFGIHRLRQILASWADRSSREIVDVIFNKVTGFCASERPEDDLTALVIKILK
jgi:sigma-B regulation protein RsbU (phosphoserine phosphatase)